MTHEQLVGSLKKLRLGTMATQYCDVAKLCEKKSTTYEQYLAKLTEIELAEKHRRKVRQLLWEAKIPLQKNLENYDFKARKGITKHQIERLLNGDFIRQAQNIVFFGDIGVGKTHLALALTQLLCEQEFRCYFTSTQTLIEQMLEAKKDLTLNLFFKRFDRYDLITCDELGYIPQSKEGADLFFQLISQRYERKSLMFTTNLTYSEWGKVFLNPITTAAAVDRIIHNCETFNLEGPSWRAEEAKKRKKN